MIDGGKALARKVAARALAMTVPKLGDPLCIATHLRWLQSAHHGG
jgi:hypothetical protein